MSIGPWEIGLILAVVLIVFGAGKLPQVMGDVAKGVKSFRAGLKDEPAAAASPDAAARPAPRDAAAS
jgi:sec-independent protein translocase protein TatA